MEGLHFNKTAWKPSEREGHITPCPFDDEDCSVMRIGFNYNEIEVRREDFKTIEQMKLRIETIERMLQKAFNQGRNHQAQLVQAALHPNARPTY